MLLLNREKTWITLLNILLKMYFLILKYEIKYIQYSLI